MAVLILYTVNGEKFENPYLAYWIFARIDGFVRPFPHSCKHLFIMEIKILNDSTSNKGQQNSILWTFKFVPSVSI